MALDLRIVVAQEGETIEELLGLVPNEYGDYVERQRDEYAGNIALTPKSAEACLMEGVDPHDLLPRKIDDFVKPGIDLPVAQLRFEAYEKMRNEKANAVRRSLASLIEREEMLMYDGEASGVKPPLLGPNVYGETSLLQLGVQIPPDPSRFFSDGNQSTYSTSSWGTSKSARQNLSFAQQESQRLKKVQARQQRELSQIMTMEMQSEMIRERQRLKEEGRGKREAVRLEQVRRKQERERAEKEVRDMRRKAAEEQEARRLAEIAERARQRDLQLAAEAEKRAQDHRNALIEKDLIRKQRALEHKREIERKQKMREAEILARLEDLEEAEAIRNERLRIQAEERQAENAAKKAAAEARMQSNLEESKRIERERLRHMAERERLQEIRKEERRRRLEIEFAARKEESQLHAKRRELQVAEARRDDATKKALLEARLAAEAEMLHKIKQEKLEEMKLKQVQAELDEYAKRDAVLRARRRDEYRRAEILRNIAKKTQRADEVIRIRDESTSIRRSIATKMRLQRTQIMETVQKARQTKNWNKAQQELQQILEEGTKEMMRQTGLSQSDSSFKYDMPPDYDNHMYTGYDYPMVEYGDHYAPYGHTQPPHNAYMQYPHPGAPMYTHAYQYPPDPYGRYPQPPQTYMDSNEAQHSVPLVDHNIPNMAGAEDEDYDHPLEHAGAGEVQQTQAPKPETVSATSDNPKTTSSRTQSSPTASKTTARTSKPAPKPSTSTGTLTRGRSTSPSKPKTPLKPSTATTGPTPSKSKSPAKKPSTSSTARNTSPITRSPSRSNDKKAAPTTASPSKEPVVAVDVPVLEDSAPVMVQQDVVNEITSSTISTESHIVQQEPPTEIQQAVEEDIEEQVNSPEIVVADITTDMDAPTVEAPLLSDKITKPDSSLDSAINESTENIVGQPMSQVSGEINIEEVPSPAIVAVPAEPEVTEEAAPAVETQEDVADLSNVAEIHVPSTSETQPVEDAHVEESADAVTDKEIVEVAQPKQRKSMDYSTTESIVKDQELVDVEDSPGLAHAEPVAVDEVAPHESTTVDKSVPVGIPTEVELPDAPAVSSVRVAENASFVQAVAASIETPSNAPEVGPLHASSEQSAEISDNVGNDLVFPSEMSSAVSDEKVIAIDSVANETIRESAEKTFPKPEIVTFIPTQFEDVEENAMSQPAKGEVSTTVVIEPQSEVAGDEPISAEQPVSPPSPIVEPVITSALVDTEKQSQKQEHPDVSEKVVNAEPKDGAQTGDVTVAPESAVVAESVKEVTLPAEPEVSQHGNTTSSQDNSAPSVATEKDGVIATADVPNHGPISEANGDVNTV